MRLRPGSLAEFLALECFSDTGRKFVSRSPRLERRFPLPSPYDPKPPRFKVEYDPANPPVPIVPYLEKRHGVASGTVDVEGMPLGVMLDTMQFLVKRANEARDYDEEERLRLRAAAVAKEAAPYVHAKLTTTTIQGNSDAPLVVQQETTIVDERKPLDAFIAEWVRPAIEAESRN